MDTLKTIRKEIKTCGKSRYVISRETGVNKAILCRIMQGGSAMAETVNKPLSYFGYELTKKAGTKWQSES